MTRIVLTAAVLPLLLAASAHALYPELPVYAAGMQTLGLQLGSAKPTDSNGFDRTARSGPAFNLEYYRFLWDWVALGAEMGYAAFGKNDRGSASALHLGVLARINFMRERTWTPYIVGGAGKHTLTVTTNDGACNPLNGVCGDNAKLAASSLTLSAGLGVESFVMRGLSLNLETRLRRYRFGTGAAESINLYFGTRYLFGR